MKAYPRFLAAIVLALATTSAYAQGGGMGGSGSSGPNFNGALGKLFGSNTSFSADAEIQSKSPVSGGDIVVPGKIAFDQGKSRFEMDFTKSKGTGVPTNAMAQMTLMGMDKMVMVSRPDKKANYAIYPGMKAYADMPMDESEASVKLDQFKIESTELARETLDGHACVKNKVTVTDDKGEKHESTVWNATDMKSFPLKIIQAENGQEATIVFKDVKLSKPDAATFDAPTNFTKYNDIMTMMTQEMMKRANSGK